MTPTAQRHSLVGPGEIWETKRRFQIEFLKEAGLKSESYFADLGCGTLRGGIPIIAYLAEGHYWGLDVRAKVLEEGRTELLEAGLEQKRPQLVLAEDISRVDLGRRFDFIWAFAVLLHMSDDVAKSCFGFVHRHVEPTGCFYASVNIGDRTESRGWGDFPIVWRSREFYEAAALRHDLHMRDLGSLSSLGHAPGVVGHAQRMLQFQLR